MQTQLVIGNEKLTIDDKCIITRIGDINGYGLRNTLLSIWGFKEGRDGGFLIGLYSSTYDMNWSDLDGHVTPGHGLWIRSSNFIDNILLVSKKYEICTTVDFKNQNLKSMQCRILYEYDENNIFVETDKDIGGSSCDGLGKAGHCIILPRNTLKAINKV